MLADTAEKNSFLKSPLITIFSPRIFGCSLLPVARMPPCGLKGPLPGPSSLSTPSAPARGVGHTGQVTAVFRCMSLPLGRRPLSPIVLKELGLIHDTPEAAQAEADAPPFKPLLAPLIWHGSAFTTVTLRTNRRSHQ